MTVEYGVTRQIWFAPESDPSDKHSFLIRDDAYSKREAVFGRTIRLGEPVDLGPLGSWRQTNWSGGMDQERWRDEAMFELGTADVSERKGSVRLWNGYKAAAVVANRNTLIPCMTAGASGLGEAVPLVWGETTARDDVAAPTSWHTRRYDYITGQVFDTDTHGSTVKAMCHVEQDSGLARDHMLVGYRNGRIRRWNQVSDTWENETDATGGPVGLRAMAPFNDATYYSKGADVWRRASGGKHSIVKRIAEARELCSFVVWNNRLWFIARLSGGRTAIYVSDGYTCQQAFEMAPGFDGWDLCPHYGSLYIRGSVNRGGVQNTRQQVWRYNGSSLSMLWEDDYSSMEFSWHGAMASWGRHLVWSKHGHDSTGREAGVWMYDAEEDAIYLGPTIKMPDTSNAWFVTAICAWNDTLAVAFYDDTLQAPNTHRATMVAFIEKTVRPRAVLLDGSTTIDIDPVKHTISGANGLSFATPQNTKEEVILSSYFDADISGERKVWLKGFLRCRVPENCQVEVALIHDDDPTEHPLITVDYDASAGSGWREVQFPAVCETHGITERSSKVRYKLYLRNLDLAASPNSTPEVDVVGLDFMPSPQRRSQWHIRALATDGQNTLAGTPNTLATRDAIVAKLTEYWEEGVPLLFWEPRSDGATPLDADAKRVMLSDFLEQSYRLDSEGTEVASEVSFNLLEVA